MTQFDCPIQVELHVPDFGPVHEFYGAFGFAPAKGAPQDDDYLVLALGNQVICFWPGNDELKEQPYFSRFDSNTKRGFGVELVIRVDDLDAAYATAADFDCVVESLTMQPWGMRDFRVEDPFGFYLRFTDGDYIIQD